MTNTKFYEVMSNNIPITTELEQLIIVMFDSVIDFRPEGKLTDTLYKLTKI